MLDDPAPPSPATQPPRSTRQRPRAERCARVIDLEDACRRRGITLRQAARELGVPRSTLRGWQARSLGPLSPAQRAFFESPEGVEFLRRLLTAALFVINLCGGLGVTLVQAFLRHAGVHQLVACSDTTLRRRRRAMIDDAIAWGDAQDDALATQMQPRRIVLVADETFLQGPMLVAMVAPAGFIFTEQLAERRDADSWYAALRPALARWPVQLHALVGDDAKGIIHLATYRLHTVKGPDLFHIQYGVSRASAAARRLRLRGAERKVEAAEETLRRAEEARSHAVDGEAQALTAVALVAYEKLKSAKDAQAEVEAQCQTVRNAVRDLGARYHPVHLETGVMLDESGLEARLVEGFAALRDAANSAGIGAVLRVQEGLDKAERSLPTMKSLARAWFRMVRATLETLGLSAAEAVWVWSTLLPWVYLDTVHPRGPRKQDRARIGQVREAIWEKVRAVDGPWSRWGVERRTEVLSVLREVVALFVRGSSSVEGRNGQLSLSHHRVHTLTPKLLRVLTVLHNYVITRDDGSTAAQRFTGLPHADLFEHLLAAAPSPARPRVRPRRSRHLQLVA